MPFALATGGDRRLAWNRTGRSIIFLLAATSIACLLFDFYGLCPMRTFTLFIFLPALLLLAGFAVADRQAGDGRLWRAVWMGVVAGLLAAVAYDLFRLPFVFARDWGIDALVPPLKLFKVFPRFGAMILGQPVEQPAYSTAAQLLGWVYHFSNGATFGVMYLALIGEPSRRHWAWAVVMAVGLELGMLFTPYPNVFAIHITGMFIGATLVAHLIFGVTMGLITKRLGNRCSPTQLPFAVRT